MKFRIRRWVVLAGITAAVAPVVAASGKASRDSTSEPPRLVLLIVVDQLRPDYLTKLAPHFTGGFAQLLAESVQFSEAHHAHAITNTAPGHATIVTGLHPRRHGIIDNEWYDRESRDDLLAVADSDARRLKLSGGRGSSGSGRSPALLREPGLPDWIQEHDPKSLTYSVGGKDRAAVLLGGKEPDGAFWLDTDSGEFSTSTHYTSSYPRWLRKFNQTNPLAQHFATMWEPLPIADAIVRDFGVVTFAADSMLGNFPHRLGGRSSQVDKNYYRTVAASPWLDEYIGQLAIQVIDSEDLGQDEHLDYLAVSFPVLDSVGHSYGPQSPEVLDTLIRLDITLGTLLKRVDKTIGLQHVVVLLTSDHGVVDFPEVAGSNGTRRIDARDVKCFQEAGRDLAAELGDEHLQLQDLYLDYSRLGRDNLRREDVENALKRLLERCSIIAHVWTRTEMEKLTASDFKPLDLGAEQRDFRQLYWNSFDVDRSGDLLVQLCEGCLKTFEHGSDHGTPYRYDTHVPVLIRKPGVPSHRVDTAIATVDIAPTLAKLLGIKAPSDLDGADRSALVSGH